MTIQVGDWVRFYQNGLLVIGVVQYIEEPGSLGSVISTDIGSVYDKYVIELRRAGQQQANNKFKED